MSRPFIPQCSASGCTAACIRTGSEFSRNCSGTNCPLPDVGLSCKNKTVTGCQNSQFVSPDGSSHDFCGNSCRRGNGLCNGRRCLKSGCNHSTPSTDSRMCSSCNNGSSGARKHRSISHRSNRHNPSGGSSSSSGGFRKERGCIFYPNVVAFWNEPDCPLMQWSPHGFTFDGEWFHTAEHFMMASKASILNDHDTRKKILDASSPQEAKRLGRSIDYTNGHKWENLREEVVYMGNLLKFQQNPDIGTFLQSTGSRRIIEGSPYDQVWGCGIRYDDPRVQEQKYCTGQNLLGKALEKVRRDPDHIVIE